MSYKFSKRSRERLETCHPDLRKVMNEVIKHVDCTIIEGIRTKETQEEYVRRGVSRTMNSKHLDQGDGYSHAIDVVPYFKNKPHIRWKDEKAFYFFGGLVMAIAKMQGVDLRWGGNWDNDDEFDDQTFYDLPHFELRK